MGAKTSAELHTAMSFIRGGMSPYQAAKEAGISRSAISQSKEYRQYKEEKNRNERETQSRIATA